VQSTNKYPPPTTEDVYENETSTAMQGSIFWMAPEVLMNDHQGYSAKIDIWSLGCVVLEMWAGRRPWNQENMIAVMFKVRREPDRLRATSSTVWQAHYDCSTARIVPASTSNT
jgi:serine/threonine protein kinase